MLGFTGLKWIFFYQGFKLLGISLRIAKFTSTEPPATPSFEAKRSS